MDRGDVWWADLDPPAGRRPVLILTRSAAVTARDQLTVAFVTTRMRNLPTEVRLLRDGDGVTQDCVVNCDAIQTVLKAFLVRRMTTLPPARMAEVHAALKFALELP